MKPIGILQKKPEEAVYEAWRTGHLYSGVKLMDKGVLSAIEAATIVQFSEMKNPDGEFVKITNIGPFSEVEVGADGKALALLPVLSLLPKSILGHPRVDTCGLWPASAL